MASLGSSIRSAARATSSAYKRLPIRWRLAGGSAALTLVILLRLRGDRRRARRRGGSSRLQPAGRRRGRPARQADRRCSCRAQRQTVTALPRAEPRAPTRAPQHAVIRVVTEDDEVIESAPNAPLPRRRRSAPTSRRGLPGRVAAGQVEPVGGVGFVQYARRLSDVEATANRVRFFLGLGVLGGTALALLAGLRDRAARDGADRRADRGRARDRAHPRPVAPDPAARRPRTRSPSWRARWRGCSTRSTRRAAETEATLARQREFVADASHELRTPLTSVLANLELLEEVLEGEQREAAASALRSSRRMRRLVADLLLLARADAGRITRHEPVDVAARGHRGGGRARAGLRRPRDHRLGPAGATISGARDELHRLALNLIENALRHTDPGTAVEASVERVDGQVVFAVEDDGPGIPPELARQGLRALLPRRRRPRGLVRPRPRDRARGRRIAPRKRHARGPAGRPRRALRRAVPGRNAQT